MGSLTSSTLTDNEILDPPPAVGYASAASSNAVTCEECQAGAAALVDKLLSAPRLLTQQVVRQLLTCGSVTWLAASTTTLFLKLMFALVLVSARRPPSSPPRDWTCEECIDIISRTADYMADAETIAMGVEYLQGDCFCGQDGHTGDCADLVSTIVPLAMPVLAGVLVEQTNELCQEVVGVC